MFLLDQFSNIEPQARDAYPEANRTNPVSSLKLTEVQITDSLLKNRFSCRHYLAKEVPRTLVEEIIDVARHSPSGNNMQPWEKVYCISGDVLKVISAQMLEASRTHPEAYRAQYDYYPAKDTPSLYAQRRKDFGKVFYKPLNVDHDDLRGRAIVSSRNYQFFSAPIAFIFTINKGLTQGAWLDVGYFLQSMTVAARARGLETVSQESTARYHSILREHLPIGEDEVVALGMSMGYPDLDKVARFTAKQPKREVTEIISFHGLE